MSNLPTFAPPWATGEGRGGPLITPPRASRVTDRLALAEAVLCARLGLRTAPEFLAAIRGSRLARLPETPNLRQTAWAAVVEIGVVLDRIRDGRLPAVKIQEPSPHWAIDRERVAALIAELDAAGEVKP